MARKLFVGPVFVPYKGQWKQFRQHLISKKNSKGEDTLQIRMDGQTVYGRINSFFAKYTNYVALGMCMRFAETAAKYTPPNMGKANIEQKYYYRPIQELAKLSKGEYPPYHATKADYAALRAGYKFRVLNTKKGHKKNQVYAYCKGINEAKRASKIAMRGLSKYSWGSMINNVNQQFETQVQEGVSPQNMEIYKATNLPPIFQRLARKSPAITKYQWGTYKWKCIPSKKNLQKINFTITNRLAEIQRYGQIAIKRGLMAAIKYCKTLFRGIQITALNPGSDLTGNYDNMDLRAIRDLRQSLAKLFETDSKSYGIQKWDATPDLSQYKNRQVNVYPVLTNKPE